MSQNGEAFEDENLSVASILIASSRDQPYDEPVWDDMETNGGWVTNNPDGTVDMGLGKRVRIKDLKENDVGG